MGDEYSMDTDMSADVADDVSADTSAEHEDIMSDVPADIPEDIDGFSEDDTEETGQSYLDDIPEDIEEENAEISGEDTAEIMRDVLEENVSTQKLPSDQRGEWDNPDEKGNSDFILKDDAELKIYNKSDKSYTTYSGQEFKEHMMEE